MTEIINLNKARKAKIKQKEKQKAQQNRVVFGLSANERKAERERLRREEIRHDGHQIKPAGGVDENQ